MALSYVEVIQSERDFLLKVLESYPAEAKACRRAAARLAVRWAPPPQRAPKHPATLAPPQTPQRPPKHPSGPPNTPPPSPLPTHPGAARHRGVLP